MRKGKVKIKKGQAEPFLYDVFNDSEFIDYAITYRKLNSAMIKEMKEEYDYFQTIQVDYVYPPIPMREFDYCAYIDPEDHVKGEGRTATIAIYDFIVTQYENDYL